MEIVWQPVRYEFRPTLARTTDDSGPLGQYLMETGFNRFSTTSKPPPGYTNESSVSCAAKFHSPDCIPIRHIWDEFDIGYFTAHLGPRIMHYPAPKTSHLNFGYSYPSQESEVKQGLESVFFREVDLALHAVFSLPFESLLLRWVGKLGNYPDITRKIYKTVRPIHFMWDCLYENLPDDYTVPNWKRLSIEEKQKALTRMIPRLFRPDHPERVNWEQEIAQDAIRQDVEGELPGTLRYLAFIHQSTNGMSKFILKVIEEGDKDLIQFLIRTIVPPTEIIPYITPYMHTDDIPQTSDDLMLAFADGRLREMLSQREPLWVDFCQAETDSEALVRIIMHLPPPVSSAGVPITIKVPGRLCAFMTAETPIADARLEVAIRLWPQACTILGNDRIPHCSIQSFRFP